MTNADLPLIRKLYRGFQFTRVARIRWVTTRSRKHYADELIITNYDPPADGG